MATIINADTSDGLKFTSDTSGEIKLQSGGADIATVSSTGIAMASGKTLPAASLTGTLPAGTNVISSGTSVSASGTSVDFTSIPSWVKRITVMFSDVSTNGTSNYQLQLGAGSVTTSGYSGSCSYSSAWVNDTAGFIFRNSIAAGTSASGILTICSLGSNLWTMSGNCGGASDYCTSSGGSITLGGTLDRIRITTVNGTDTFDAGSINILYE